MSKMPAAYAPGELLGPTWLPKKMQNKVVSCITPESLVTSWEVQAQRVLEWVFIVLGIAALATILIGVVPAWAQSRPSSGSGFGVGDFNAAISGFRAIVGISVTVVPFLLLAYYTWKMKPKDVYEAAWLSIGWCALAFILR